MGLNIGILVEAFVSILLLITIGYCLVLNRRLKMLRADEATLKGTIAELTTAAARAESAIAGLKVAAGDTESALTDRTREANDLARRLAENVAAGEDVMERLSAVALAAGVKPARIMPTSATADREARVTSLRERRAQGGHAA